MTPIYFPFSLLSSRAAAYLGTCFPVVGLYLPSESVRDQVVAFVGRPDFVEPRVPEACLDRAVEDLYRSAMQWKEATVGADLSFQKVWEKDRAPFFDETTISYLRKNIMRQGAMPEEGPADLLSARLFLRLALDHDLRKAELIQGINTLEAQEKNLFEALRGGDEEADDLSDGVLGRTVAEHSDDPGTHMVAERMRAWSVVAASDTEASGIFITDSGAVCEHIQERCGPMMPVAVIPGIPARETVADMAALEQWQSTLSTFLQNLVHGRADTDHPAPPPFSKGAAGDAEAVLSIFRVSNMTPHVFFETFAPQPGKKGGQTGDGGIKHIVIGQLTIN